ncbi:MAG: HAMP domain-containing histidine kinase [Oligoflexales bacterium]|nr:HAMP domain-containing histidine kinase [Oligoflexales bacterium]
MLNLIVELEGVCGDLPSPLIHPILNEASLVFDLHKLKSLNSRGIRSLIDCVQQDSIVELRYKNCPIFFIDTINMVPDLLGKNNSDIIENFYLPHFCTDCKVQQNENIFVKNAAQVISDILLQNIHCRNCKNALIIEADLNDVLYLFTQEFMERRESNIQLQVKQRFINQLSHDFKASLKFLSQQIKNTAELPQNKRSSMDLAIKRLTQFLQVLKDHELPQEYHFAKCDFDPSLIAHELNEYAHLKGVTLAVSGEPLKNLFVNLLVLERALLNLLINAIEAAEKYCELKWQEFQEEVVFEVKNDGNAIEEDDVAKIYEKGFSRGKISGTGTGLFIAQQAANIHDGELVHKRAGVFTIFLLKIRKRSETECNEY